MKQILFSASCFSHPWISLLSKERKDLTDSPGMGFSKMSLLLKNIFLTRVIRNSLRISHLSRKDWWESTGRWSCVWCHLNHGIQQYKVLEASVLSAKFITSGPCWGSISASSALMHANPNSSPCPQKSFHGLNVCPICFCSPICGESNLMRQKSPPILLSHSLTSSCLFSTLLKAK